MHAYSRDTSRLPLTGTSDPLYYIAEDDGGIGSFTLVFIIVAVAFLVVFISIMVCIARCREACARAFKVFVAAELFFMFAAGLYVMISLFAADIQLPLDAITFSVLIFNASVLGVLTAYLDRVSAPLRRAGLVVLYLTFAVVLGCVMPALVLGIFLGCMCLVDLLAMVLPNGQEMTPFLVPATFQMIYDRPRILYQVRFASTPFDRLCSHMTSQIIE